ncbi:hypothetical protein HMI54_012310 [Coelomomyces lativittatus]|nr:hypothetical protein HMI55_006851 [Coelomomyces lativittatus]KAJ1515353.1 hypothetical protein HMI56_005440 [Coelomomyces lativittatus]KAJ1515443.1 hypothetical protein HMI54_012310 [Coelomomyces lativittatus]
MSTTTALLWIPPGICKEHPTKVEYTNEEYERISQLTGFQLNESKLAYENLKKKYQEEEEKEKGVGVGVGEKIAQTPMNTPNKLIKKKGKASSSFGSGTTQEIETKLTQKEFKNSMDMDMDMDIDLDSLETKAMARAEGKEEKEDKVKEEEEGEEEGLDIYHFSDYEEEDEEEVDRNAIEKVNIFPNLNSLVQITSDGNDPYLQLNHENLNSDGMMDEEEEENEEKEDVRIDPTDHLLCLATHQDGLSVLEFQVFTKEHQLYPHHDILLPTFPLCLAQSPPHLGHWLAVGTMQPEIEIWDFDQLDPLVPVAMLGTPLPPPPPLVSSSFSLSKKKKKKTSMWVPTQKHNMNKKQPSSSTQMTLSHTDSVLTLAWHEQHGILASGSADGTVKLWDPASNFELRRSFDLGSKVGTMGWTSPSELLVGTLNAQCTYFDTRTPTVRHTWTLSSDPEHVTVVMDPSSPTQAYVALDQGTVLAYDLRHWQSPVWQLDAHATACTCVAWSPFGLATVGDEQVKVWQSLHAPTLMDSKHLGLGSLFSCAWCPGVPGFLAVGGEKGSMIVDFLSNTVIDMTEREDEENLSDTEE